MMPLIVVIYPSRFNAESDKLTIQSGLRFLKASRCESSRESCGRLSPQNWWWNAPQL